MIFDKVERWFDRLFDLKNRFYGVFVKGDLRLLKEIRVVWFLVICVEG